MILEIDIKRIYSQSERCTDLGILAGNYLATALKWALSKTVLVVGFIACTVFFTVFGMLNRKGKNDEHN